MYMCGNISVKSFFNMMTWFLTETTGQFSYISYVKTTTTCILTFSLVGLQTEIQAVEAKQLLADNFKQREDMRRLAQLKQQQEEVNI